MTKRDAKEIAQRALWLIAGAGIALSVASFAQLNFTGAFAAALCATAAGAMLWIEQEDEG